MSKEIELKYIDWKTNVTNKGLKYKSYIDGSKRLVAFDGPLVYLCRLNPDDESDYTTNLETNETGRLGNKIDPLADTANLFFRGTGKKFTATKNSVTDHDFTLPFDRKMNGVQLILKNHVFGDTVKFQVVHPVYGILNEFGTDWNLVEDKQDQSPIKIEYPANIPTGLILRIKYASVGTVNDVSVNANYFLHEDTTI